MRQVKYDSIIGVEPETHILSPGTLPTCAQTPFYIDEFCLEYISILISNLILVIE